MTKAQKLNAMKALSESLRDDGILKFYLQAAVYAWCHRREEYEAALKVALSCLGDSIKRSPRRIPRQDWDAMHKTLSIFVERVIEDIPFE